MFFWVQAVVLSSKYVNDVGAPVEMDHLSLVLKYVNVQAEVTMLSWNNSFDNNL